MQVSGWLDTPTASCTASTGEEAGWTPQPFWTLQRSVWCQLLLGLSMLLPWSSCPQPCHYTDWAILAPTLTPYICYLQHSLSALLSPLSVSLLCRIPQQYTGTSEWTLELWCWRGSLCPHYFQCNSYAPAKQNYFTWHFNTQLRLQPSIRSCCVLW